MHASPISHHPLASTLGLLTALLGPSFLQAQTAAAPVAVTRPVRASPIGAPTRYAVESETMPSSETYRLVDGWPMLLEGAVVGALIGGGLGASGRGATVKTALSGAGVGTLIGGAVGTAMYALLWLGRPKRDTSD